MSPVLAVVEDGPVREHLRTCAAAAGVYLDEGPDPRSVADEWARAQVVFLDAGLAEAAVAAHLPAAREVAILADVTAGYLPFQAAVEIGAAYVAILPTGRAWLTGRLRRLAVDTIMSLRAAGFRIGYTDPRRARTVGYVWCGDLADRPDGDLAVFVEFGVVAQDVCQAGQSSIVQRSNFRSLHRAHPGVWTNLEFANTTVLGAFLTDLPPDLVRLLCTLAVDDPVFDDEDHSRLEDEEIRVSWPQWVAGEVYRLLGPRARQVWDGVDDDIVEHWWWDTVHGIGYRPDHDGHNLIWDHQQVVAPFAARLMAEYRRGWRTFHAEYRIISIEPAPDAEGPQWTIEDAATSERIAIADTRLTARILAWRHAAHRRAIRATPASTERSHHDAAPALSSDGGLTPTIELLDRRDGR